MLALAIMTGGVVALVAYALCVVGGEGRECATRHLPQGTAARAHTVRRVDLIRAEGRAVRTLSADRRWSSR